MVDEAVEELGEELATEEVRLVLLATSRGHGSIPHLENSRGLVGGRSGEEGAGLEGVEKAQADVELVVPALRKSL
jgi:hypothetical protein